MNPTKELLAKLDELGVEYDTYDLPNGNHGVSWIDGNNIEWEAVQIGENFEIHALQLVTPEQAIAATVGGSDVSALRAKVKAQSDYIEKLRDEYKALKDQTERCFEEYRDTIRKLKAELDAATVGAGTCHDLAETPSYRDKTEFKCSECGYEYSAVGGFGCDHGEEPDFSFCPNCGKKVVSE